MDLLDGVEPGLRVEIGVKGVNGIAIELFFILFFDLLVLEIIEVLFFIG